MQYSIVNLSDVKTDNNLFRFDADFFHPFYLRINKFLEQRDHKKLMTTKLT